MASKRGVDPRIIDLLKRSGKAWHVRNGKRHLKIIVEGVMITVIPATCRIETDGRRAENSLQCVRRHLRSIGVQKDILR